MVLSRLELTPPCPSVAGGVPARDHGVGVLAEHPGWG